MRVPLLLTISKNDWPCQIIFTSFRGFSAAARGLGTSRPASMANKERLMDGSLWVERRSTTIGGGYVGPLSYHAPFAWAFGRGEEVGEAVATRCRRLSESYLTRASRDKGLGRFSGDLL